MLVNLECLSISQCMAIGFHKMLNFHIFNRVHLNTIVSAAHCPECVSGAKAVLAQGGTNVSVRQGQQFNAPSPKTLFVSNYT